MSVALFEFGPSQTTHFVTYPLFWDVTDNKHVSYQEFFLFAIARLHRLHFSNLMEYWPQVMIQTLYDIKFCYFPLVMSLEL
jgi:hypothetical protein